MAVLRTYLWLWVIAGMILSSLVIVFVFICINLCISKKGRWRYVWDVTGGSLHVKTKPFCCTLFCCFTLCIIEIALMVQVILIIKSHQGQNVPSSINTSFPCSLTQWMAFRASHHYQYVFNMLKWIQSQSAAAVVSYQPDVCFSVLVYHQAGLITC